MLDMGGNNSKPNADGTLAQNLVDPLDATAPQEAVEEETPAESGKIQKPVTKPTLVPPTAPEHSAAATMDEQLPMASKPTAPSCLHDENVTRFRRGERLGEYEIVALHERGGMGLVYVAVDARDRTVAIKTLQPTKCFTESNRRRFDAEIEAVKQIVSEHVVQFFASGIHRGVVWMAMDFLEGETLRHFIAQRGGCISRRLALHFGGQLALALMAIHACNIVHRDLKPGNVMVCGGKHLTVFDFGVSKCAELFTTAQHEQAPLTPAYMSPEQAAGHRDIDGRADIYNLGLIMYELVSGRLAIAMPDGNVTIADRIARVRAGEIDPLTPNECDPDVAAIIYKCLQVDRDQRYSDAAQLANDISALIVADREATASSIDTQERMRRRQRSKEYRERKARERRDSHVRSAQTEGAPSTPLPDHTVPLAEYGVPKPDDVLPKAKIRHEHTVPLVTNPSPPTVDQAVMPNDPYPAPRIAKTRSVVTAEEFRQYLKQSKRRWNLMMIVAVAPVLLFVGGLLSTRVLAWFGGRAVDLAPIIPPDIAALPIRALPLPTSAPKPRTSATPEPSATVEPKADARPSASGAPSASSRPKASAAPTTQRVKRRPGKPATTRPRWWKPARRRRPQPVIDIYNDPPDSPTPAHPTR